MQSEMQNEKKRLPIWSPDREEDDQERLRYLADISRRTSQPFWVGYLDGRIIAFNRPCCELLGYPERELRSMDWAMDLTPSEWRETETRALEYLHLTGQPQLYEKECIRQDGSRVIVEVFIHPVCDFEGNIQYYYAFITDISNECRKVRQVNRGGRRRSKCLPLISSPVIYACQPTGGYPFTFVSRKVKALFGYEPAEFLSDPGFWIDHVHPEDVTRILTLLTRLAEKEYYTFSYRFRHKDGTYHLVHNVLGLMRDSDSRPQEIIGRWIEIAEVEQHKETRCGRSSDISHTRRARIISAEKAQGNLRTALW
ncbi:MAG: PAS domain-containing protein [bacterium]